MKSLLKLQVYLISMLKTKSLQSADFNMVLAIFVVRNKKDLQFIFG